MIELFHLILGILASLFKSRARLKRKIWSCANRSTCCAADSEAAAAQQYRSLSVGLALSLVPLRPQRDCDRQAVDDHPLASRGVSVYWRWRSRNCVGRPRI